MPHDHEPLYRPIPKVPRIDRSSDPMAGCFIPLMIFVAGIIAVASSALIGAFH